MPASVALLAASHRATASGSHVAWALLLISCVASAGVPSDSCAPAPQLTIGCDGCHDTANRVNDAFPSLHASSPQELLKRLRELRDHGSSELLMPRLLRGLDDNDLQRIATHYACISG